MIWELIEDYKKEYQQSGWKFHTRYKGRYRLISACWLC